jgi:hypothetical protein
MSERLLCLVVVLDFLEVRITVLSSVIRMRARPPDDGRGRGQRMRLRCGFVIMDGNV